MLERTLAECQQKPVPFLDTVPADAIDIGALDAIWGNGISDLGRGTVRGLRRGR